MVNYYGNIKLANEGHPPKTYGMYLLSKGKSRKTKGGKK